ncbi:MAG: VCBS repeat-containing protein [Planctomycetaceae bacterium]|nr:VCBS repeat-containing protein [Planctomycetaceae bacterium]
MAVVFGFAGTMLFAQEAKPLFKMQKIDDKRFESCGVGDFNNDGHPDIVAGEYIYFGPDFTKKIRIREIQSDINENGDGYAWDFMDMPMDVDGDGLLDIVTLSWHGESIEWLKNPGDATSAITPDKLDSFWEISLVEKLGPFESGDLWDIRGNGKEEGLVPNPQITLLYTVGKKEDGSTGLIRTLICDKPMAFGSGVGDVNGDGRPDILRPNAWFEAPEDILTGKWIEHPLSLGGKDGATDHTPQILVLDVNKDGRNDIITSSAHGYGIFWYEQLEGKDQWKQHTIDDTWTQAHALCLADIDGCGEPELIAGKRFRAHNGGDPEEDKPQRVHYYKNAVDADGKVTWTRYTISYDEGVGSSMAIYAVDLTGNGTLDLVMTSKSGGPVVFFNQTKVDLIDSILRSNR